MSVILTERNYTVLRNNDPSWQAMTRVTDTNNTFDVRQEYIKRGNVRNDFKSQLNLFDNNKGLLNDGTFIDMTQFFMDTVKTSDGKIKSTSVPYFKFKTNAVINSRYISGSNSIRISHKSVYKKDVSDTYITKTHYFSKTSLKSSIDNDSSSVVYKFGDKEVQETEISSFPLQRVDKLVINEFASLFVYINGIKIPDSEVYIYSNKMYTDVFVPSKYISGNIHDDNSDIDCVFNIDYRQSGSECLYYYGKINGNSVTIDLTDDQYKYEKIDFAITNEKILAFVNGKEIVASSIERKGNLLTVNFPVSFVSSDLEFYILNDVVYRYKFTESQLDNTKSKLNFFINDDYKVDIITGPITKSSVSFFYDGERIDDSKIVQTSRFSFELDVSNEQDFDESKIDFLIEDLGRKVDDKSYSSYGDDYYLLNMLGVKRCVDKMKGKSTYSIFDDTRYSSSFKEILSNNGELFDVNKAIIKYDKIKYSKNTATERSKQLIKERPTLLRRLMEQWKVPNKRFLVYGNAEDVKISSVSAVDDVNRNVYYKIYINCELIDSSKYITKREALIDYITIDKSCFNPLKKDDSGNYISGVNTVELYQYDLTYKEKSIYRENISKYTESGLTEDGDKVYSKHYTYDELPFGEDFLSDDVCAVEQVSKNWYDSRDNEYYLMYPSSDNTGYRMVKKFYITDRDDTGLTINIQLHEPDKTRGYFFILIKQYNVVEEFTYTNADNSYMIDNDLVIPIYSKYIVYDYETKLTKSGTSYQNITGVSETIDYIPYINNSEPIISKNGKELIYGKDYTFLNPETSDAVATSCIVLKSQPSVNDIITIQFNSTKTNVLIVGYDDLEIDNRYGLIYLSELKCPVSPEYMNIFINGNKLSAYDIDILSDKLIRVHNVTRPIKTILITTNLQYKMSEIQDYIDLYTPSSFESILEEIFWNCDPSKQNLADKPNVDFVYKMNPYYSDFVGDDGEEYDNAYYKEYVDYIIENGDKFTSSSSFSEYKERPSKSETEAREAWDKANVFFESYKSNHGFIPQVDSIYQKENSQSDSDSENSFTDTLELMYINWLSNSGKTRTQGFKEMDIDPVVLKYFSIYENVIINDRIDVVIDSNRTYDGMMTDVTNPINDINEDGSIKHIYPGSDLNLRRRFFYEILLDTFESEEDLIMDSVTGEDSLVQAMCNNKLSNILYPQDFPLSPTSEGIKWTGTDIDIINIGYGWNKTILESACEQMLLVKAEKYVKDCSILKYFGLRYILNKIYPLDYDYDMDIDSETGYYASIKNALIKYLAEKDGITDTLDAETYDKYEDLAKTTVKELINIIYPNTYEL